MFKPGTIMTIVFNTKDQNVKMLIQVSLRISAKLPPENMTTTSSMNHQVDDIGAINMYTGRPRIQNNPI